MVLVLGLSVIKEWNADDTDFADFADFLDSFLLDFVSTEFENTDSWALSWDSISKLERYLSVIPVLECPRSFEIS